jgi:enoyl-CoA hydratase/carnithine racemase
MTMSLQEFVPNPRFEEYRETFRDFYRMERRDDGVLFVAAHTLGGPVQLSVQNHRSLGQMLRTVGADPDNEILILTGSGEEFMMASDPEGFAIEEADMEYWAYEYAYKDGRINVSALVNDVEIPTIGLLNGPGFHSEIVLMCDITLAAEDAVIFDLHYDIGSVPADGIHNAFQELLGVKRAAYALLTGEAITARQALEWGMVNEVVPRDQLIPRAYQIADHIMTQPRTVRRLTTQIVRRPWKQRIVSDLDGGFGIQMFGHIAKKRAVHGEEHIRSTVDYVREGRKNNFDLPVTVGRRAMLDVLHDDGVLGFVDSIEHAPLGPDPGTVESGQGSAERPAYPVRRLKERSRDELDGRGSNVLRERFGNRTPVGAGHRPEGAGHVMSARSSGSFSSVSEGRIRSARR